MKSSIKPSIEKLKKFFKLEADREFDNKAVMGGLQKMLDTWVPDARADGIGEDLINAVSSRLRDYPRLSVKSRRDILSGIWKRVMQEMDLPPIADLASTLSPTKNNLNKPKASFHRITKPTASDRSPNTPKRSLKSYNHVEKVQYSALQSPITVIQGIGPKYAQALEKLGISTIYDLIYHFPRRYDDYAQFPQINKLESEKLVTLIGTIQSVNTRMIKNGKLRIIEAIISDGSGAIRAIWFNQPWLKSVIVKGNQIVLSGKTDRYLGHLYLNNPEVEQIDQTFLHTNQIVPVYPLTAKIRQRRLRKFINQTVQYWAPRIPDYLPEWLIDEADLLDISTALLQIHFPNSMELLDLAKKRLAFDELFLLQVGVTLQKQQWKSLTASVFSVDQSWLDARLEHLPFTLTNAQSASLDEIIHDLSSGHPMSRLLQGDVGSGKTIVAAIAIAIVASQNGQTALMAPTSILAEQHYKKIKEMLTVSDPLFTEDQIRLLIGSTPASERNEILADLASGKIKLLIGTHAIIEDPILFDNLQFAVIDEQHRFGVKQRSLLRKKGTNPHLLVMTATPIPRSLSLTIYGDLDVSIIDEMPVGRQEIITRLLAPSQRDIAYRLIDREISNGHQAYIIYPIIEENQTSDFKSAVAEYNRLKKEIFPNYKLGLLHGKLKPSEKNNIMTRFRDAEIDILVSTSVIEVGVDVPNATVMVIEGANRFGLAQLHQFRGRVGRGSDKSYCVIIPSDNSSLGNERLKAIVNINNGFQLAEKDLELRGPGEFLGTRQSGFSGLRLASITDLSLIKKARHHAQKLIEKDPSLSLPENALLSEAIDRFWDTNPGEMS